MRPNLPAWTADRVLHILLALALVRGLVYVSVVPPWQHYDEPGHFEYTAYLARHHRLPTNKTIDTDLRREMVASMTKRGFATYQPFWRPPTSLEELKVPRAIPIPQYRHPPLYYALGAGLLSLLPSKSLDVQLYALRLMSVALDLILILFAAATVSHLLPGKKEILYGVLLFVIFLPPYSDVATAVSNDVLANVLFAGLVYLLIRQVVGGPSWRLGLATVCIFTLGLVTKRTTVVGLFAILAVLLFLVARRGRNYLWAVAIILILVGLLAGIAVFDWTADRGLTLSPQVARYLFWGSFSPFLDSLLDWERSWPVYQTTIALLFRGFWGHFGWGTEAFTPPLYGFLLIVTLIALIGVVKTLVGGSNSLRLEKRQKQALWVLLFTLAMVWLAALLRVHPIQATGSTYLPRARYTYVAIVPAAILFVTGLYAWVPSRWRGWLVAGLTVGGLLLDTLFLAKYLLPFYLG